MTRHRHSCGHVHDCAAPDPAQEACPATDAEGWHCVEPRGHHGPHRPAAGAVWVDR